MPTLGLYASAFGSEALPSGVPPVTSAEPSGSNVAVWLNLAVVSELVAVQVPVDGLYNSAAEIDVPPLVVPPAISACPLGSNVAVWE